MTASATKSVATKTAALLEMIKFKLTLFALPFAFTGALLAAGGLPKLSTILFILLAMVGARTCAMTFNRIADRQFDAANPRTAGRALPAGQVKLLEAWLLMLASAALFFIACRHLNLLTLKLAPLALGLTLFYSLTKRFTSLCHLVLGVAQAFSPLGGWVAVSGSLADYPWALSLGVGLWVAGFDTIYACQDAEFDRHAGLHSLPSRVGPLRAFRLAALFHLAAFLLFAAVGITCRLNFFYWLGLLIAAGLFINQHRLVAPDDLSRLQASFFSMNGLISVTLFAATLLALLFD